MVIGNLNLVLKNGEKISCVYENDAQLTNKEFVLFLNKLYFASNSDLQIKIIENLKKGKSENALFTYNFDTNTTKVLKLDCKFEPLTKKYARGKLLETFYID